jgi:formylmethanofuran dehydrogenase subunit E
VQTDKPYYSAGEEIWFKAYLVNETTLEPNALSQFVYVELIDKMDSVLYRVKGIGVEVNEPAPIFYYLSIRCNRC